MKPLGLNFDLFWWIINYFKPRAKTAACASVRAWVRARACVQQTEGLCPLSPDLPAQSCRSVHFIRVQSAQALINGRHLKLISAVASAGCWNAPVSRCSRAAVPVHIYIVWLHSNLCTTALFSLPDTNLHQFVLFIMSPSSHWCDIKCSCGKTLLLWSEPLMLPVMEAEPEFVTEETACVWTRFQKNEGRFQANFDCSDEEFFCWLVCLHLCFRNNRKLCSLCASYSCYIWNTKILMLLTKWGHFGCFSQL